MSNLQLSRKQRPLRAFLELNGREALPFASSLLENGRFAYLVHP